MMYKKKRALGKKANTAILSIARRMARIAWQLLTQGRDFETTPPSQPDRTASAKKGRPSETAAPLSSAAPNTR